ncbi:DUF1836 domain-containing protein [Brassicibacter mesophilus]|uniref:DUF1836 domain-containing protein n=1 Tax=Brassicibacter mesophilus TaxID=745119 RepID=UPI003D23428E
MQIDEKILNQLIEDVSLFDEIGISDIPCIDLYMDQVTTFFDDKLGHLKRDEKDTILTKTMINNYTKDKILMPPKSKKYNKQHMILLVLIYYLKQIISINDIKSLFTPLLKDISSNNDKNISVEDIYNVFLEIKKSELDTFNKSFEERLSIIKEKLPQVKGNNRDMTELLLLVLALISQANAQKRLAEKIIDNFFK